MFMPHSMAQIVMIPHSRCTAPRRSPIATFWEFKQEWLLDTETPGQEIMARAYEECWSMWSWSFDGFLDDNGLKRPAKNLNRGDSHTHDFVIHPVWEDGSCQHLYQTRFGRGFSDTLRKG